MRPIAGGRYTRQKNGELTQVEGTGFKPTKTTKSSAPAKTAASDKVAAKASPQTEGDKA
ncbi:hypothetical protein [Rhizobium halophytocola]|uniref:Uncharacterized protein n=1 Tax=Rhizobium halophytocola TaxID=735519 RepID=A0ABS4E413_9HYPH|nr:hypothetical protein [Rhizobium halophytocola]MBP1852686.1 hypothetical protein [Rhizobium halophytocola]